MGNIWQELLSFIPHKPTKQGGYVLLTSIIVLLVTSTVIVYQYRYYADYQQLERRLYQDCLSKIHANLDAAKVVPAWICAEE